MCSMERKSCAEIFPRNFKLIDFLPQMGKLMVFRYKILIEGDVL